MAHLLPRTLHKIRHPVPGRRIVHPSSSAAIGAHSHQAIIVHVSTFFRFADDSGVRVGDSQRVDHGKPGAWLQRVDRHPVKSKDLCAGAFVILRLRPTESTSICKEGFEICSQLAWNVRQERFMHHVACQYVSSAAIFEGEPVPGRVAITDIQ